MSISRRAFLKGAALSAATVGIMGANAFATEGQAEGQSYEIAETLDTDILILGSGAAGSMAAGALVENDAGLRAILIERGDSCAASNGSKCGGPALVETAVQEAEGAVVTVQQLFTHMYSFSNATVNGRLLYEAIRGTKRVYQYLADTGVEFQLRPDSYNVGFRARHGLLTRGEDRFGGILNNFMEKGGQVIYNCQGEKILRDESGAVCGAVAYDNANDRYIQINAKAVLVATGGYLGNADMIHEAFGNIDLVPLGSTLSDGKGINMVLEAGGIKDRNWAICANEFGGANAQAGFSPMAVNTKYAIYGGLLVNKDGKRFMNEQLLSDQALSVGGEPTLREGTFYAILDEEYFSTVGSESVFAYYGSPEAWSVGAKLNAPLENAAALEADVEAGWAFKADSLGELAGHFGLTHLEEEVEAYNSLCEAGEDSMFGKSAYLMKAIGAGPYYAFEYNPSAWCTFGGVRTDERCRVVDADLQVIPGLYAAGVDCGSLYSSPYYDNEGAAAGLAMGSGVVAGDSMVEYVKSL